jgi:DNA-binding NarL/FixJ family response regulator
VIITRGSARYHLGVAAAGAGRTDEAVEHLRRAAAVNLEAGLRPAGVEARCRLAEVLVARDQPGDRAEAAEVAAAAATAAEELGMQPVLVRALAVQATSGAGDRDGRDGPLSRREVEIAGLVARGLTNREIAAEAHIAERTAENHVQHILTKLGLRNRTEIAAWHARRTT